MKHGAGQERHDERLVRSHHPPVQELSRGRIELGARGFFEKGDDELRAAPYVHEHSALRTEKPTVRAFEGSEPCALLRVELSFDFAPEAPARHCVAPERTAALLEPRVLGGEGARALFELGTHRGDPCRILGRAAELDDPCRGLEHSHG